VVLSVLLSDAVAGLFAIKRCGGTALVQVRPDAVANEMPLRALEARTVDLVPSAGDVLAMGPCRWRSASSRDMQLVQRMTDGAR
jgi:CheB methylesterase